MHIQSLGSPATSAVEDRPVQPVAPIPALAALAKADAAPPTREQVAAAVKQINASLPPSSKMLEFSIDDDSKQTIVKIVDQDTKEVVRQIPSVTALEIAKSLDKMMGLLISHKA